MKGRALFARFAVGLLAVLGFFASPAAEASVSVPRDVSAIKADPFASLPQLTSKPIAERLAAVEQNDAGCVALCELAASIDADPLGFGTKRRPFGGVATPFGRQYFYGHANPTRYIDLTGHDALSLVQAAARGKGLEYLQAQINQGMAEADRAAKEWLGDVGMSVSIGAARTLSMRIDPETGEISALSPGHNPTPKYEAGVPQPQNATERLGADVTDLVITASPLVTRAFAKRTPEGPVRQPVKETVAPSGTVVENAVSPPAIPAPPASPKGGVICGSGGPCKVYEIPASELTAGKPYIGKTRRAIPERMADKDHRLKTATGKPPQAKPLADNLTPEEAAGLEALLAQERGLGNLSNKIPPLDPNLPKNAAKLEAARKLLEKARPQ